MVNIHSASNLPQNNFGNTDFPQHVLRELRAGISYIESDSFYLCALLAGLFRS